MKKANLNAVPPQTAEFAVADEIIRLKALGNSLEALAIRASEGKAELDTRQVEEIGPDGGGIGLSGSGEAV